MKKWYRGIVVKHKEIDSKMYHCFDDENFKILTKERNEQLKEIERLNNIINKLEKWLGSKTPYFRENDYDIGQWNGYVDCKNKLQELKGSNKK